MSEIVSMRKNKSRVANKIKIKLDINEPFSWCIRSKVYAWMIAIAILNIFEKTCWSLAQSVSLSSEAIPFIPLHARFGVALLFRSVLR